MLTLWGEQQKFCDGVTRRGFLKIGALGAAGLTLADLLRLRAQAGNASSNKACIMIYLPGGPSHMDMYDLKPDAPSEFRGQFKPIQTNVPGVQICEHFPMQARMWDKLACIRSLVTVNEHSDTMVMTGYPDRVNRMANHPSFGAVVSKVRSTSGDQGVPAFVSLRGSTRGTEPGFLGIAHRPFTPSGPGLNNLRLNRSMAVNLEDRRKLLSEFDTIRRDIDASGSMAGMDDITARAFEMVTSGKILKALDLSREDPRVRDRYKGVERFLTARRLIEAGCGVVTLAIGGWDTHSNNFKTLEKQLPQVDRAVANLVQDLHDRGMDKDVSVVMWGEFGRTPRINKNSGRDHWPQVMSALIAGGGLKMGQAIGESTSRGERPKDRPISPSNVLSTLYRAMGIDPSRTFNDPSGRPIYILDEREPVHELL
ncbi:MAG: hypothetical protein KatS3mg105_4045 [Gemmatales bacterium]|nr:MAG: hypothetical protein KatS3mg105_4045 [Gemmatales bacterium]